MANESILIVEDDPTLAYALAAALESQGYVTHIANTGEDALINCSQYTVDLVFLDFMLPGLNGLEVMHEIKEIDSELPILFMTSQGSIDNAVTAMQAGASDYIVKPLDFEVTGMKVEAILEMASLRREVSALKTELKEQHGFDHIAAQSPPMLRVMNTVRTIACSEAETVLLLGESGVGKNLIAKAIHYNSSRAAKPFTNITCTALAETLLESELFGYEKGAFTDAGRGHKGLFEISDGGTIFLDEIGDMPLGLQAKLLGVLESRNFRRVGSSLELMTDVRIIAATNQDLKAEVGAKRFRADLYYRLNVIDIHLPPLRDRRDDIPGIASLVLTEFNKKFRKQVKGIDADAMEGLQVFDWPGNVRELRNILERAVILTHNEYLSTSDFPMDIMGLSNVKNPTFDPNQDIPAREQGTIVNLFKSGFSLVEHERDLVRRAYKIAGGNKSKAASLLGLTRNQMVYRLKKMES